MRPVLAFTDPTEARVVNRDRGDCLVFDVHGLLWSVPVELSVIEAHAQMVDHLRDRDLIAFHPTVVRPHVADVRR